jgi:hypothetical protein
MFDVVTKPYNVRQWKDLCHKWICYTFVYFVLFICIISAVSINYDIASLDCTGGTEIYLITSLLFGITLIAKACLLYQRSACSTTRHPHLWCVCKCLAE